MPQHHPALLISESGWLVHSTSIPGIAGSIATAGSPAGAAAADPPAASGPLPPALRSAHARRLPYHYPALPLSEAGWVGHCTGRPGIAGSIATAGSPAGAAAADPPAASGPLPPARRTAHAHRLPQHHPALPLSEAGWVGHCTGSPSIVGSKPPAACCSPTATPLGGLAPARRRPAARHPQLCGP